MGGKDDDQIRLRVRDAGEGPADSAHGVALVLPAVRRHQKHTAATRGKGFQLGIGERNLLIHSSEQSVYYRVARHHDVLRGHALSEEVRPAGTGGRQVQGCDLAGDLTVRLFRERRKQVAAAEAGFNMDDGNAVIESGDSAGSGRSGVALDDHRVRLGKSEQLIEPAHGAGHDVRE